MISASDFQAPQINTDHFVYHGRVEMPYPNDETELRVYIAEHTTFIEDSTLAPFRGAKTYSSRALAEKLKSSGKKQYEWRSALGSDQVSKEEFPSEFQKPGIDGFVFVMDPTAHAQSKQRQLDLLVECTKKLPKKKALVVALSKCDALPSALQEQLKPGFDLAQFFTSADESGGKAKSKNALAVADIPVFFTSAKERVCIDDLFCYIAHVSCSLRGQPSKPLSYVHGYSTRQRTVISSRSLVWGLLRQRQSLLKSSDKWVLKQKQLMDTDEFSMLKDDCGLSMCSEIFRMRIVEMLLCERCTEFKSLARGELSNGSDVLTKSAAVRAALCEHVDLRMYLKK